MKTATAPDVREQIQSMCERVAKQLPDVNRMSESDLATVLLTYRHVIQRRFVPWLAQTWRECRSDVARHACWDNLACEVGDNHPQMLWTFVAPLETRYHPSQRTLGECTMHAGHLDTLLSYGAIPGLLLLAALENSSLSFIAWMNEAAGRLGLQDLTYLQVHGEADIAHANEFLRASEAELDCVTHVHSEAFDVLAIAEQMLVAIFHAHLV